MKKGILLLLGLLSIATIKADDIKKPTNKIGVNYNYSDAVSFVERGVQFHVFLDGDFDFNTRYNSSYVDYNGRRTRSNRRVRIERDFHGRVRRVGNTFINYDIRGNVKRIGSVYMRYNRGQLRNVGNLKIRYDRWGNPRFYGQVKNNRYNDYYYNNGFGFDIDIRFGDVCDYDDAYFYRRDFRNNYSKFREDNNFYYYKAKPNAKIGKRSKILKRRKPSKSIRKNHSYKKRKSTRKTETDGIYEYRKKKVDTKRKSSRRQ